MLVRVVDEVGNKEDVEMDVVPRVGDRIWRHFNHENHFFVVKDVMHQLITEPRVAILVAESGTKYPWPS